MVPGPFLLRGYNDIESNGRSQRLRTHFDLPDLDTVDSQFTKNICFTYDVKLSKSSTLGLTITDDPHFGITFIKSISSDNCFYKSLSPKFISDMSIVGIHTDEPIHAERFKDYIKYFQEENILKIRVTLSKRVTFQPTKVQE